MAPKQTSWMTALREADTLRREVVKLEETCTNLVVKKARDKLELEMLVFRSEVRMRAELLPTVPQMVALAGVMCWGE